MPMSAPLAARLVAVAALMTLAAGCPKKTADDGDTDQTRVVGLGGTCIAAPECGGRTPLCTGGFCVECQGDATCGGGEVCGQTGLCAQCAANTDCGDPGQPFCSDGGSCVECQTASDCGAAEACDGRGECVDACNATTPCQEGVCDPVIEGCVECLQNTDCPDQDQPLCGADARCVQCAGDGDCGAGEPFCTQGRCRECIQNTDCAGDAVCNRDLECQVRCESDAQCGDQQHCDTASGDCRECVVDGHCTDGDKTVCVDFNCEECRADTDCPVDQPTCDQGECKN